jgi:hypothetical protein
MLNKSFLVGLVLAATALVPSASFAAGQPERSPCILRSHRITQVAPYKVQKYGGRGVITRLAGAQVYVQAEPGLTAQWLELQLTRHIGEMRGPAAMRNCALDVDGVTVRVGPAGTGFDVKIIARDPDQAEDVLRRARLLLE